MEIIEALQEQFIPYAGEILCNNLPNVADGLLPVQRKVLWALHKNKVTNDKPYIKLLRASAMTMVYYVFGDLPLASAMKNMANNGINYFYLDPKGSFGDKQKKEGVGASPRYIECRLSLYSQDMLKGIDKNTIPTKRNFDNTEDEPLILPSMLPNVLINTSQSIAVGEASRIYSHNLIETCNSVIDYIKNKDINKAIELIKCPDFIQGGKIIYDKETFRNIYLKGKGSFSVTGNYIFNEKTNTISIIQVPYGIYIEDIEDKIRKAYDKGLLKEIADIHDNSGRQGIQLDIILKKNTNVESVISKIRKYSSYESKLSFNMTLLKLDCKTPKRMSLQYIYDSWISHRINCIKKEYEFDINKTNNELHLLFGLKTILNDLDTAIKLIRQSKNESEATEKLKVQFKLSDKQAEYIAGIRLININKDWIQKKISNIDELENKQEELKETLNDEAKIKNIICEQLEYCKKKYGQSRRTEIIYNDNVEEAIPNKIIDNFNCKLLLTSQGYIKKLLRYTDSQKLKEGDSIKQVLDANNIDDLLIFTNKGNCFKLKLDDLQETKPSNLGDYINNLVDLDKDESVLNVVNTNDYKGWLLVGFENGKITKITLKSYETKTNRSKLVNALNGNSPVINIIKIDKDVEILCKSSINKVAIFNTSQINEKSSKSAGGVNCLKSKNESVMSQMVLLDNINKELIENIEYYKANVNAVGTYLKKNDVIEVR